MRAAHFNGFPLENCSRLRLRIAKFPRMTHVQSEKLFAEALNYIPGGVNSPVRAFRAVGGQPFFVNKAKGARVWDVDGNEYDRLRLHLGPGHSRPRASKNYFRRKNGRQSTAPASASRIRSKSPWPN